MKIDTKMMAIIAGIGALGYFAYTQFGRPKLDPEIDAALRRQYNIPSGAKATFDENGISYTWEGKKIDLSRDDIEGVAKAIGKVGQTIWGWLTGKSGKTLLEEAASGQKLSVKDAATAADYAIKEGKISQGNRTSFISQLTGGVWGGFAGVSYTSRSNLAGPPSWSLKPIALS